MEATEITEQLKSVIIDTYGDRVGTFKLQSVDEETSKARQKARGQLSKEQRLIIDRALVPFRDWLIDRDPEAAERVANGSPAPQDIETAVRAAEDHAGGGGKPPPSSSSWTARSSSTTVDSHCLALWRP